MVTKVIDRNEARLPFFGDRMSFVTDLPANNMDKDFLSAIMQIRRYLYGNMTEITLKKYLNGTYKILTFKGIMSFYPLVTDERQMADLDKWLVSTILNTLKKGSSLFISHIPTFNNKQFPFNCNSRELVDQCKVAVIGNKKKGLLEIPSFLRIYRAIKMGLVNEGIDNVMNPKSYLYYDK